MYMPLALLLAFPLPFGLPLGALTGQLPRTLGRQFSAGGRGPLLAIGKLPLGGFANLVELGGACVFSGADIVAQGRGSHDQSLMLGAEPAHTFLEVE
jgi:hypothetical protein